MTEAKLTWSIWQALLKTFAWAFTCRVPPLRRVDYRHGAERQGTQDHPVGPGLGATRRLEGHGILAEYGSWHQVRVTQALTRLIATAPGRIWHRYKSRP